MIRIRESFEWSLTLGESYSGGSASHVVRARTADGVDAVLKLSLPHREARDEAAALRWWDGHGAIRVLAHDPADASALLLGLCAPVPGSPTGKTYPRHNAAR